MIQIFLTILVCLVIKQVVPVKGNDVVLFDTAKNTGTVNWILIPSPFDRTDKGWSMVNASIQNISTSPLRVFTTCSQRSTSVNTFLVTPFIEVQDARSLYVEIKFTMRKCPRQTDPGLMEICRETFNLLQTENNGTAPLFHDFTVVDKIAATFVGDSSSNIRVNTETRFISLTPWIRGIHFAFQNTDSCITIASVKVYYKECPNTTYNYAYFPATPTGINLASTIEKEGKCVSNASPVQKPLYRCFSDGQWGFPTGGCQCDSGFEGKNNKSTSFTNVSTVSPVSTSQTMAATFKSWLSTTSTYSTAFNRHTESGLNISDAIDVGCDALSWNLTINLPLLRQIYPKLVSYIIYLGENRCTGIKADGHLVFQYGLNECLTNEIVMDGGSLYSNELVYAEHDPVNTFIIKHYNWTYGVQCDLRKGNFFEGTIPNNGTDQTFSAEQYPVNVSTYLDSNFMHQIPNDPLRVNVGSQVYVKVFSTTADWSTYMKVRTCYIKPREDASDHLKYLLIQKGCEQQTTTHIISESTHETRFVFEYFEYIGRPYEGIYVF